MAVAASASSGAAGASSAPVSRVASPEAGRPWQQQQQRLSAEGGAAAAAAAAAAASTTAGGFGGAGGKWFVGHTVPCGSEAAARQLQQLVQQACQRVDSLIATSAWQRQVLL